jgi:cyclopropane fatty-acyl-phospholipid synthase-like methyltransferase
MLYDPPAFPRSAKYSQEWLLASVSGAANPLWMTEWLTSALDLKPGMRVLDLGCGRGVSSIFLQREFGVQVWSTDLWFSASERAERIRDAGCADAVFAVHADARALPYARDFFDAIVAIDSYIYFGTDDLYLNYLTRFVKPGGQIGIAGAGLVREFDPEIPEHLRTWWTQDMWCLHSAAWWRRHWERTGIVEIEVADTLANGCSFWLDWIRAIAPDNESEIAALEADADRYLGYVRTVGRRKPGIELADFVASIPAQYKKVPLLRS